MKRHRNRRRRCRWYRCMLAQERIFFYALAFALGATVKEWLAR